MCYIAIVARQPFRCVVAFHCKCSVGARASPLLCTYWRRCSGVGEYMAMAPLLRGKRARSCGYRFPAVSAPVTRNMIGAFADSIPCGLVCSCRAECGQFQQACLRQIMYPHLDVYPRRFCPLNDAAFARDLVLLLMNRLGWSARRSTSRAKRATKK